MYILTFILFTLGLTAFTQQYAYRLKLISVYVN